MSELPPPLSWPGTMSVAGTGILSPPLPVRISDDPIRDDELNKDTIADLRDSVRRLEEELQNARREIEDLRAAMDERVPERGAGARVFEGNGADELSWRNVNLE